MNSWLVLLTMLGGGTGAALRFLADHVLSPRISSSLPIATAVINFSGSAALGFLTGFVSVNFTTSSPWLFLFGVGLIGGYTTFSTVSVETARLVFDRRYGAAMLTSFVAVSLCVGASYGGFLAGSVAR